MSIEQTVYSRLNDASITSWVSTRIYNTDPTTQTDWPFLVYNIEAQPSELCLGKATGNQQYSVSVDVWAKSVSDRRAIEDAVKARMNAYTGSPIQLLRLSSENAEALGTQEEGDVYHGQQGYVCYT